MFSSSRTFCIIGWFGAMAVRAINVAILLTSFVKISVLFCLFCDRLKISDTTCLMKLFSW